MVDKIDEYLEDCELDKEQQLPIRVFAENSYLNYSMYVIMDRALPNITDGLKPVQRRIIYAMSELGLSCTSKYKKSSRTVGDVLGKFHPHGDSACYEAMVLMAQSFSYRYPIIDGHGNWGSPDDPRSFAAMRYTESRLSKNADFLLEEINQGAVEWTDNFDGTLREPKFFPSRLPHILLNGVTGIAVGMTTDIPPHNIKEVINACLVLLKKPNATLSEILKHIQAPDFPTGAEIITPKSDIKQIYKIGKGSIKARSTYESENKTIVITSLPYQVTTNKVIRQIAAQIQNKKLNMLSDIRDESSHEDPIRISLLLKGKTVDADEFMLHLFATTDLEKSYRVNFNMIGLNGCPEVKGLLRVLNEWLEFRVDSVKKRLSFKLIKLKKRMHLLEGLAITYKNIEKIIKIICSYEKAKDKLLQQFPFSEEQVVYILDMKLRQLAKLEQKKIVAEKKDLKKQIAFIEEHLQSDDKVKGLVAKELQEDLEKYGDDRLSELSARESAQVISDDKLIVSENISVILSKQGLIKTCKGHLTDFDSLAYKEGDSYTLSAQGKTNHFCCLLSDTGKIFSIPAADLPAGRGYGSPITKFIDTKLSRFVGICLGDAALNYCFLTNSSYGFVANISDILTKKKQGKQFFNLKEGDKLLHPIAFPSIKNSYLLLITSNYYLLMLKADDLPLAKKGSGFKLISSTAAKNTGSNNVINHAFYFTKSSQLTFEFTDAEPVVLTMTDLKKHVTKPARRGKKLPASLHGFSKVVLS